MGGCTSIFGVSEGVPAATDETKPSSSEGPSESDAALDGDAADADADATPDAAVGPECVRFGDCPAGQNCNDGRCKAALASCADQKRVRPKAPSGLYWVSPRGTPLRAYCDMSLPGELCTEAQEEHRGKTHEGSNLGFLMTSVLVAEKNVCSFWALRNAQDGLPFFPLKLAGGNQLSTCEALGFVADATVATCAYGDSTGTDCGYPSAKFAAYGNVCSGCTEGNGESPIYRVMRVIHSGSVVGDLSGSVRASCRVAP